MGILDALNCPIRINWNYNCHCVSFLFFLFLFLFIQLYFVYFIDLYHWNGPEKVGSLNDDDDDTEKRPTTYVVATGCLIVTLVVLFCRNQAQKLFNNKKLLIECEAFQHDDLRKAELLQKDLKRDVKVKLPSCKNQLVSLYAPLLPKLKSE